MLSSCLTRVLASHWHRINRRSQEAGLQVFSMVHHGLPSYYSNVQRHTHALSRMHIQGWLNHSLTHKIMLEKSASDTVGCGASYVLRPGQSAPHHSLAIQRWKSVTLTLGDSFKCFLSLAHSWLTHEGLAEAVIFPNCSAGSGAQQMAGRD